MQSEFDRLQQNQTWDLVDLPDGNKVVGCKWAFKHKHDADGQIQQLKARLIAQKYSGKDHEEILEQTMIKNLHLQGDTNLFVFFL